MARRQPELDPLSRALPTLFALILFAVVVVALAVLPARTWYSQREALIEASEELQRLEYERAQLAVELDRLETDDEVERIARRDYDLVFPGEESYQILPAE